MDTDLIVQPLTAFGRVLLPLLTGVSLLAGILGAVSICGPRPVGERLAGRLLMAANLLFLIGFLAIAWFHWQIYLRLPLELPESLAGWLNGQLAAMNRGAAYGLPLYDPGQPPRYLIPLWIENEKYYFWAMCYAALALVAYRRLADRRFRGALCLLLAIQAALVHLFADPFAEPLPRFFAEIGPWFQEAASPYARLGQFMQLYPRMVFYYNASYMWFHPPLLFLSYACITLVFATSVLMLARRELPIEALGYTYAKLGYFLLTLGMLLGYPWALQAWGPNWWWDPKICSSIMLWALFSTYLHTRLYANKRGMWYFSSGLGILCFLAMIFTFLASFLFPGEHTFQ